MTGVTGRLFRAISDGEEKRSYYDFGQLRTSVGEAGVQVYCIKIVEPWSYDTNGLSDIAEMTGGAHLQRPLGEVQEISDGAKERCQ